MLNVEHAGDHRVADLDGIGIAVDEFRLGLQGFLHRHDRHEVLLLPDHRQIHETPAPSPAGAYRCLTFISPVQVAVELQGNRLIGDLLGIVDIVQTHVLAHEIQQLDQCDRLGQSHRQEVFAIGGDRLIRRGSRRSRRRPRAGGRETDLDGLGRRVTLVPFFGGTRSQHTTRIGIRRRSHAGESHNQLRLYGAVNALGFSRIVCRAEGEYGRHNVAAWRRLFGFNTARHVCAGERVALPFASSLRSRSQYRKGIIARTESPWMSMMARGRMSPAGG